VEEVEVVEAPLEDSEVATAIEDLQIEVADNVVDTKEAESEEVVVDSKMVLVAEVAFKNQLELKRTPSKITKSFRIIFL
jgi:hypothetical protein